MGALGGAVTMSLACTRTSATARPRFLVKTWWLATGFLGRGRRPKVLGDCGRAQRHRRRVVGVHPGERNGATEVSREDKVVYHWRSWPRTAATTTGKSGAAVQRFIAAHDKEACRTAKATLRTAKRPRTAKALCRTAKNPARQRLRISHLVGTRLSHKRALSSRPPSLRPPSRLAHPPSCFARRLVHPPRCLARLDPIHLARRLARLDPIHLARRLAAGKSLSCPRTDIASPGCRSARTSRYVSDVPRWRRIPGVAPHYIPPPSTFNVLLDWFDKPWFLTEGNLLLYASHLPLGVPNERVLYASSPPATGRPVPAARPRARPWPRPFYSPPTRLPRPPSPPRPVSRATGPKYPGKNMNVYLEPLVDDLVRGWEGRGIQTYDASKKEYFDIALRPLAPSPLPFAARASPPGELPPLLRRTSPSFVARRFLAVHLVRPQHSCFFELFSASPSLDLLDNCKLAAPPAIFSLSNSAASGTFFYVKNDGAADLINLPALIRRRPKRPKTASPHRSGSARPLPEAPYGRGDPDPYIHWTDLEDGPDAHLVPRNSSSGSCSTDDFTVLEAEAGREFLEKLVPQGQKNKAPAPDAGSSQAPPSKRFRTEAFAGKVAGKRRYKGKTMPTSSGPALKLGPRPEGSEGTARTSTPPPQSSPAPSGAGNASASPLGGTSSAGRAAPTPPITARRRNLSPLPRNKIPAPATSAPMKKLPGRRNLWFLPSRKERRRRPRSLPPPKPRRTLPRQDLSWVRTGLTLLPRPRPRLRHHRKLPAPSQLGPRQRCHQQP
ncbi:hypothetical protein QYE76_036334 [Lolium multiflorum]|uniref:Uncharacterized protein n=1 Tax=Lolium multiflorum TaxID=4521 RepID=A0AAD8R1I6_LOLMU|nr:hypothetical protein QYE76_036334 [Lolium multiflorum]